MIVTRLLPSRAAQFSPLKRAGKKQNLEQNLEVQGSIQG